MVNFLPVVSLFLAVGITHISALFYIRNLQEKIPREGVFIHQILEMTFNGQRALPSISFLSFFFCSLHINLISKVNKIKEKNEKS